jgi:hypothetical protein
MALIVIIAAWTAFGLLGVTTALTLAAAVLICAAFTRRFSSARFLVGAILGLAAYGMVEPSPATTPATPAYAVAEPTPQHQLSIAVPSPAVARPAPIVTTSPSAPSPATDAVPTGQSDTQSPAQASADPPRPNTAPDLLRRSSGEQRARHAAKADCGSYRLQPSYNCTRGQQWRRDSFLDFGHSFNLLE